ncbi:MAG: ddlA [Firmicutes bacterium]|nr:ddlA [Bacillota bacterium]
MMTKINVGILFGGKSTEHEVSLQSAKNVLDAIDREKYNVTLIGIDKGGRWYLNDHSHFLLNSHDPKRIALNKGDKDVVLVPGDESRELLCLGGGYAGGKLDVIFPVLHGAFGEDGTMQGLLKLVDVPFVGAGVLGSAIAMDKDVAKRLLRDAGVPIAKFLVFSRWERKKINFQEIVRDLGLPLFVKPANAGSSVGVSKVKNEAQFAVAIDEAFSFDRKILIEECMVGREVECAVLGNERPIASAVGEIIAQKDFYSYEAKYIDENGALLKIPAELSGETVASIQEQAIKAYQVLCCEGMARVDFFLTADNVAVVNEINTIPGFTKISMYPKLWEISGISYPELIDRLIQLALARYGEEQQLETSYEKN